MDACNANPILKELLRVAPLFSDQDKGLKRAYQNMMATDLGLPFIDTEGHLLCTKHLIRAMRRNQNITNTWRDEDMENTRFEIRDGLHDAYQGPEGKE